MGSSLLSLPITTRNGYQFLGWYFNDLKVELTTIFTTNANLIARWEVDPVIGITFEVTFITDDNVVVVNVNKNDLVTRPADPVREGYLFAGWYLDTALFNFNTPITADLTLTARFAGEGSLDGFNYGAFVEAIWVTWTDTTIDNVSVYYSKANQNNFNRVDQPLIRRQGSLNRVDIVGLAAGAYDVRVINSNFEHVLIQNIYTTAFDRSGYARFGTNDGVGAYNNDGTLKDNAIVVYVTDENKNNITIPGLGQTGLGWILNNAQYNDSRAVTHNPTQFEQSLAFFNRPISFRFIGTVNVPQGLTIFNSSAHGGPLGDQGDLGRMRDANNISFVGIGTDAMIYGWGIHFIAATPGRGRGLEVRNLTFKHYSEDAVGMEGMQTGNTLDRPTERGWIHNNTFYPGFHPNPV
jgi:uncharacterized repeat protein (TIGR02543 family)